MPLSDLFKKAGGQQQDPEPYDEGYDNEYYDNFEGGGYNNGDQQDNGNQDFSQGYAQPQGGGVSIGGAGGIDIKVVVVKPERFESVPQIADHLLNKRTVVLNLEATNRETARRLIDFLSGVAYSIDGNLRKIANNAYVITPSNVEVSGETLRDRKPPREPEPAESDPFTDID